MSTPLLFTSNFDFFPVECLSLYSYLFYVTLYVIFLNANHCATLVLCITLCILFFCITIKFATQLYTSYNGASSVFLRNSLYSYLFLISILYYFGFFTTLRVLLSALQATLSFPFCSSRLFMVSLRIFVYALEI